MNNTVAPLAHPLRKFCTACGFSIRHFYDLEARGEAPPTLWIGHRRYVRHSTGEAWLAARENMAD